MPASDYVLKLRKHVGHDLIWLPAATAVVMRSDGKFLLLHHQDSDRWAFPGGQIEFGETPEAAALRELKEETGIEAEIVSLLAVQSGPEHEIHYRNGDRVAYLSAFYLCRDDGKKEPIRGDEAKAVGYYTLDEIEKLDIMPWMRSLLPLIRTKLGR